MTKKIILKLALFIIIAVFGLSTHNSAYAVSCSSNPACTNQGCSLGTSTCPGGGGSCSFSGYGSCGDQYTPGLPYQACNAHCPSGYTETPNGNPSCTVACGCCGNSTTCYSTCTNTCSGYCTYSSTSSVKLTGASGNCCDSSLKCVKCAPDTTCTAANAGQTVSAGGTIQSDGSGCSTKVCPTIAQCQDTCSGYCTSTDISSSVKLTYGSGNCCNSNYSCAECAPAVACNAFNAGQTVAAGGTIQSNGTGCFTKVCPTLPPVPTAAVADCSGYCTSIYNTDIRLETASGSCADPSLWCVQCRPAVTCDASNAGQTVAGGGTINPFDGSGCDYRNCPSTGGGPTNPPPTNPPPTNPIDPPTYGDTTPDIPVCTPNCSCSAYTCNTQNCSDGCGGVCNGSIAPSCDYGSWLPISSPTCGGNTQYKSAASTCGAYCPTQYQGCLECVSGPPYCGQALNCGGNLSTASLGQPAAIDATSLNGTAGSPTEVAVSDILTFAWNPDANNKATMYEITLQQIGIGTTWDKLINGTNTPVQLAFPTIRFAEGETYVWQIRGVNSTCSGIGVNQIDYGAWNSYYFKFKDADSWFQVMGGATISKTQIDNYVPYSCVKNPPCVGALSANNPSIGNFNNGLIGSQNMPSLCNGCTYGQPNNWMYNNNLFITDYNYDRFFNEYYVKKGLGTTFAANTDWSTIKTNTVKKKHAQVAFVNGDLNIDSNNSIPTDNAFMVIVKGNITISKDVTNLDGIFVSDKTISLDNTATDNQLTINGVVFSATSDVKLTRQFITQSKNNNNPAAIVKYRPDMLFNLPIELEASATIWGTP